MESNVPSVPLGVYRRSDGEKVQLLAVARHVDGEMLAVYVRLDSQDAGGAVCVAEPLDTFMEEQETAQGTQVRFEFIGTAPAS